MNAVRREFNENVTTEARARERESSEREGECERRTENEDILIQNDGGFSSVCVRETMSGDKMECWNR